MECKASLQSLLVLVHFGFCSPWYSLLVFLCLGCGGGCYVQRLLYPATVLLTRPFHCSQQHPLGSYVSGHWGPNSSQDPRSGAGPLCRCAFSLGPCAPSTFSLQLSAA